MLLPPPFVPGSCPCGGAQLLLSSSQEQLRQHSLEQETKEYPVSSWKCQENLERLNTGFCTEICPSFQSKTVVTVRNVVRCSLSKSREVFGREDSIPRAVIQISTEWAATLPPAYGGVSTWELSKTYSVVGAKYLKIWPCENRNCKGCD